MIGSVRVVAYGREATLALRDLVGSLQAGDPLGPVTVVVPSNLVGVTARRLLASGEMGPVGRGAGLVNVGFVTPFRLAEMLGEHAVAQSGRRPLTSAVLGAAVRAELQHASGFFAPVAGHPATGAALVQAYAELTRLRPDTRARLQARGSARARAVLEVLEAVRARLAGWYDEDDLAQAATTAVTSGRADVRSLGAVVLHLPQPVTPALADVLAALGSAGELHAIVALTGHPKADEPVRAFLGAIGVSVPDVAPAPPTGTHVVRVTDPEEEVLTALRLLLELAADATVPLPLHRAAIAYTTTEPYARILHETLAGLGIPYNGPAVDTLAHLAAGRLVAALLTMVRGGLARDDVVRVLDAGPLCDERGAVPAARWDLLSRHAGVIGGPLDWDTKLRGYLAEQRDLLTELRRDAADESRVEAVRRQVEDAERLGAFVRGLDAVGSAVSGASTYHLGVRALTDAIGRLTGGPAARARWPEQEQHGFDRVEAALQRVALLDEVAAPCTLGTLTDAVGAELTATAGRIGRIGQGVLVAPLAALTGADLEAVVIVGMAEGLCPAPRRDDALVPDADRALAEPGPGELTARAEAVHDQHRAYLAAVAAGSRARVLVQPRGDHRSGHHLLPSRWLLETVSQLVGRPVYSSEVSRLEHAAVTETVSSVAALRDHARPASLDELDLQLLLRHVEAGRPVREHPLAATPPLARGLALQEARASGRFTRFDGLVGPGVVPSPTRGEVVSATRLETWAACPFRYLLGNVLHLSATPEPERLLEIDARDRGNLVHQILERFLRPVVDMPPDRRPDPDTPWSAFDHARLHAAADEAFAAYEAAGHTGKGLLWRVEQSRIRAMLDRWLRSDDDHRRRRRTVPEAVELAFGEVGAPVSIDVGQGRVVRFRGRIDRVDLTGDGRVEVLDYKSGKSRTIPADRLAQGTKLQLAVYGLAARQHLGAREAHGDYWYVDASGVERWRGYALDDAVEARLREVVRTIAHGIDEGMFTAAPGAEGWPPGTHTTCRYCDFDDLCPSDRLAAFEAKQADPALAGFLSLGQEVSS